MTPSVSHEVHDFDQPLRLKVVCESYVPMSENWILEKVAAGEFPRPAFRFGPNSVAFSRRDVLAWLETKRISYLD